MRQLRVMQGSLSHPWECRKVATVSHPRERIERDDESLRLRERRRELKYAAEARERPCQGAAEGVQRIERKAQPASWRVPLPRLQRLRQRTPCTPLREATRGTPRVSSSTPDEAIFVRGGSISDADSALFEQKTDAVRDKPG